MNSRTPHTLRSVLAMVTVMAVLLTACSFPQPAAGPQTTPSPKGEPIKVALIGPLTGINAVLGEWQKKGYLLVFDEVNAAGGIHGRPILYQLEDDEADPTRAVNLAHKVILQDKVLAAHACPNSTPTLAVVPIFAQYKVPHLTAALNIDITNKGSAYVFRTAPAGPAYENTLVDFLVAQGYKKYAIISDNSAFGTGEGDYQVAALARNGGLKPTIRELYGIEDTNFTVQLNKILSTNPEVLLIAGSEIAAGLITRQARQAGFRGVIAGGTAIGTPKFIETAGKEAAEGVIFASPYISPEVSEVAKAWAARYKARWGEELESHGAQAIDGANMLVTALNNAYPNITSETIAAELHKIKGLQGIQGVINVDERGESLSRTAIGIIRDGQLTPYKGQ